MEVGWVGKTVVCIRQHAGCRLQGSSQSWVAVAVSSFASVLSAQHACGNAGHTLTSKIKFEDVIRRIASLVQPSWYPVILSLEVHCTEKAQMEMARILRRELGDKLYAPSSSSESRPPVLPSPASLRGKVICKGPWAEAPEPDEEEYDTPGTVEALEPSNIDGAGLLDANENASEKRRSKKLIVETSQGSGMSSKKPNKEKKNMVTRELSDVIFLGNGNRKELMERWKTGESFVDGKPANHICSFSESVIGGQGEECHDAWVAYNARNLSRTYPSGMRVDSSNYDPLPAWGLGCQLVALNFQYLDGPIRLNTSLFALNGDCGYVLKPMALRGGGAASGGEAGLAPDSVSAVAGKGEPMNLHVKVLCAINVPANPEKTKKIMDDIVDPYVKLHVRSMRSGAGSVNFKARTSTILNSVNPVWNFQVTLEVPDPDLSLLCFKLMDDDAGSDFNIGEADLPVWEIREGLRCVSLREYKTNQEMDCCILCDLKWIPAEPRAPVEAQGLFRRPLSSRKNSLEVETSFLNAEERYSARGVPAVL